MRGSKPTPYPPWKDPKTKDPNWLTPTEASRRFGVEKIVLRWAAKHQRIGVDYYGNVIHFWAPDILAMKDYFFPDLIPVGPSYHILLYCRIEAGATLQQRSWGIEKNYWRFLSRDFKKSNNKYDPHWLLLQLNENKAEIKVVHNELKYLQNELTWRVLERTRKTLEKLCQES